jgi:replication factor A1
MENEDIAPHVKEVARVLGNKVEESKIAEEMETYLKVYRVSLETAKRSIVKNFGGDPNALSRGGVRKKVAELGPSEGSVDLLVKIMSAIPKEVETDNGKKQIVYGMLADESGAVPYTLWDMERVSLKQGEVFMLHNAYTKEFGGKVQVNLGNRASAEIRKQDEVQVDSAIAQTAVSAGGETVKVASLQDGMNNVTVTGKILSVESKEVEASGAKKIVFSGMLADETGKVQYSAWHDFGLKPNEVVTISRAYVKGWRGVPKLNFGERSGVMRLKDDLLPDVEASRPKKRSLEDIERVGGATDVLVEGTIVDIKEGSGLIFRCPQCKRVVQKGACRIHGKVEGIPDLRIKAVIDDGTAAITAVIGRGITEALMATTLEACMREAREAMNMDVIKEHMDEKLFAKPVLVRGNVMSDEFGLMMIVNDAKVAPIDVKEEATHLLVEQEGFQ